MVSSKKGIAMLIVIALVLMLLILGGAVLMISTGHFSTSHHQIERTRAFYAAEAAMQHALWSLRTGQTALPTPGNTAPIYLPGSVTEINGIPVSDISITVKDENTGGETPLGVHPINIVVDY